MNLKKAFLVENRLVFFFALAVIAGPAISILFAYDLSQLPDSSTYLGLAHFDFEQSVVRRYRVIIPFVASALNFLFGNIFNKLSPTYFTGDFGLAFSFFLVNSTLMAYFGQLIYRFCRAYHLSRLASVVGVLVMLTSRYTTYFAALPLIDSLVCVSLAMALLGIKEKNTGLLIAAIYIGPVARESFIFIAPVIFFFATVSKPRLFIHFLVSGLLVISLHYFIDRLYPPEFIGWLKADLWHAANLTGSLAHLFSFYGLYKVFINLGLWLGLLVLPLLWPGLRKSLPVKLERYLYFFMASVLVQMLLSTSIERMFYLAMPVLALMAASVFEALRKHVILQNV